MEVLQWLEAWPGARLIRASGTAYLLVNAAHILGIGLIVGAILPLDLRLLGLFRRTPLEAIGPFLSAAAACGVLLAIGTGIWLFSVRPADYIANTAFLAKLGLLAAALLNLAVLHATGAWQRALEAGSAPPSVKLAAVLSMSLWIVALVAGRWIGFL